MHEQSTPRPPQAPADDPVFVARGLSKVYTMGEVQVHALRGVDLEIYASEFVVLLGPSGSGKSTLLNILGGLDTPTAGTAVWRDHDLTHAGEAELTRCRREHVGFVFQFYNLIPSLTARENGRVEQLSPQAVGTFIEVTTFAFCEDAAPFIADQHSCCTSPFAGGARAGCRRARRRADPIGPCAELKASNSQWC